MSLADNTSEADIFEANDDDTSMSGPGALQPGLNYLPSPPTSPLYGRPVSDDRSTPFSKRYLAVRRARSTARYSAYIRPSREQRQAFSRNSRRKEMFVDGLDSAFIPLTEPSAVHPTADLALLSVREDMATPPVEEHLTTMPYDAHPATDQMTRIPDVVDRLGLRLLNSCNVSEQTKEDDEDEDVVNSPPKSRLTIKIPGVVDRLALRMVRSCDVNDQTEQGEDVDYLSLDGSTVSDSSSSSDGDDDHTSPSYSSSPVPAAAGPDRSSRRRRHRRNAAPYHREGGTSKRKELWVDTDVAGSEVPAFLLGSPAGVLRSDDCRC